MTDRLAHSRFINLTRSIRRRRRRLLNSMAHVRQPRSADLERWRAMEAEIENLEAVAKALRPDLYGGIDDAEA